jgi:hypothetical protein
MADSVTPEKRILAFQTGYFAPGCNFKVKSTMRFCLLGPWPKIQAVRYCDTVFMRAAVDFSLNE